ncbi:uncharacterized protein LOC114945592 [Nylanderia fulva]|uniref:uncharacterized protein LOC114945592 n=1 Tax=Nylanderia fulva TaxID=613905 RepID=UPI0010FAE184|nr:uncharacterized protein LOC114945592 [Nylanderia fulva]
MHSATVCIAFVLTCTSGSLVAGLRYIDPQPGNNGDIGDKRLDLAEPSCDVLRLMWRYTKRQSRAVTKATNGYPMYPYPNIWQRPELPPDRDIYSRGYTRAVAPTRLKFREELEGRHSGRPRSRAAGGAPIYGRMVHKAPAGSRWRNAMRGPRIKAMEELSQYGIVNTKSYSPNNHRITSFRVGGGISSPKSVPQAGSFDTLKNLIQAERARELQEQHLAEEMQAKIDNLKGKDRMNEEEPRRQQSRNQYFNPFLDHSMPPKVNYDYNSRRIPNTSRAWSRSDPISREYIQSP